MKNKGNITQVKEIIGMIRENYEKEAVEKLDAETVKKADKEETALLLFELVPKKSRAAREMTARILEFGRPDLTVQGPKGESLLDTVMKYERTDILGGIVMRIKKKDLKKKELKRDWTDVLIYLLAHQQKILVQHLLEHGILAYAEEEELEKICLDILKYKDAKMAGAVLKYMGKITVKILYIPETASEKQFLRQFLNEYVKRIDLEEGREQLWEIAFASEAERLMKRILAKKKDYQYLSRMAGSSDAVFHVLDSVRPGAVITEVRREVLLEAFLDSSGKVRYEYLDKKGWTRGESRKEKLSILAEMRKITGEKRYAPNRRGQQEKAADQNRISWLEKTEKQKSRDEKSTGRAAC